MILTLGGRTSRGLICRENSRFRLLARPPCSHGVCGWPMSGIHPECFGTSANAARAQSRTNPGKSAREFSRSRDGLVDIAEASPDRHHGRERFPFPIGMKNRLVGFAFDGAA